MKYKKFGTIKLLGSVVLVSTIFLSFATTVIKTKQANLITIGDKHKVIPSVDDDILLTTDNTEIIYETTLQDAILDKELNVTLQDGDYLGVVIENRANTVPYTLSLNEYINKNGDLDHEFQEKCYYSKNSDLESASVGYTACFSQSNNIYRLQLGDDSTKCADLDVKVVVYNSLNKM